MLEIKKNWFDYDRNCVSDLEKGRALCSSWDLTLWEPALNEKIVLSEPDSWSELICKD
jgi:hypothetical protein